MITKWLDEITERSTRKKARQTSRRGFLQGIGVFLVGATAYPLLPVFRNGAFAAEPSSLVEEGDTNNCN